MSVPVHRLYATAEMLSATRASHSLAGGCMRMPPRTVSSCSLAMGHLASDAEQSGPTAPKRRCRSPLRFFRPELALHPCGLALVPLVCRTRFVACNGDSVPRLGATAASATSPALLSHSAPLPVPTAKTAAESPHSLGRPEPAVGFERCQTAALCPRLLPLFWRSFSTPFRPNNRQECLRPHR